ncbi:MAG TPA: tryptophanase [Pseudobdellovibrionaceae bacterium]|nr:tryptophanase [Pseudobdellovibrionaceae bacterium]
MGDLMGNFTPKTVFEPFKIKMVEPIPVLTFAQRQGVIREASFNLFKVPSKKVTFDFLTDSGTSAMSAEQWAAIMRGDESYAGSTSYEKFESVIQNLTHLKYVIPTHQGRAAEALLMNAMVKPGQIVIGNTHFDTTRANIETAKAVALDLPSLDNKDSKSQAPFKGNINLEALTQQLEINSSKISMVIMTVTNNSVGGQPVSMENIKATKQILKKYNIPLFIDAARFAENAYFIKKREAGFAQKTPKQIAQEMFSYADGVLMSAKKDAFGNIGGFLALNDEGLTQEIRNLMVITEGFPTYGGLAGRDLEALAVGLEEILDENYLEYRIQSVTYFGQGLASAGLVTLEPFGGHAVYIDAALTLPQIKVSEFPGQSLCVFLYEQIGVRGVEVGSVMLGSKDSKTGLEHPAPKELVRLAMPRRVYTQSHIDYIIEVMTHNKLQLPQLKGYEFTYQAPILRHFTAKFKPLDKNL